MKVLLIYPGLADGFASYAKGSDWFNHGVGIISAILKKEGHEVVYLDCRRYRNWGDVRGFLAATNFEIALISVATVDYSAFQILTRMVREVAPQAKVIAGGPHPTLATDEMLAAADADCLFTHEAELTLPGLLKDLAHLPKVIRGEMPPDLDLLPLVDRSLAPHGETPWFWGLKRPFFTITASRGCPYQCTFCQPAERFVFGNRIRKRSVAHVLNELEELQGRYGMKSFMIHDDCFTQFPEWVADFCREKVARGLRQPFVCQTRADIVCKHPELMEQLAAAGLKWVLIGFESGSDRLLSFIKKGATVEQNLQAATICRRLGIRIFANYMFGLPTETAAEMRQTADMIRQIAPDICSPAVFTPAPGSELYDYCLSRDLMLISSSDGYRRNYDSGAKIKGVDYALVREMVKLSMKQPLHKRARHILHQLRTRFL